VLKLWSVRRKKVQFLSSVCSRAEVIIMHTPSTSGACEAHAYHIEKSIAFGSADMGPVFVLHIEYRLLGP
jgi:hypothetical protein